MLCIRYEFDEEVLASCRGVSLLLHLLVKEVWLDECPKMAGSPRFVLVGRGNLFNSRLIISLSSVTTATFWGLAFLKSLTYRGITSDHTPETIRGRRESPSMSFYAH
mmetsp:Transcript_3480/g.7323  ORF Transcript_3480/g.7323 Transcript_3480/m.7323 type:complete len:107 (+) Transcript_3480:287-607(+)